MTTPHNPPQYANQPVILVHLIVKGVSPYHFQQMYWCAPYEPIEDTGAYPTIPRVQCPACAKANT